MSKLVITLHDLDPQDVQPLTRWLDELLPSHEAIADYTIDEQEDDA